MLKILPAAGMLTVFGVVSVLNAFDTIPYWLWYLAGIAAIIIAVLLVVDGHDDPHGE